MVQKIFLSYFEYLYLKVTTTVQTRFSCVRLACVAVFVRYRLVTTPTANKLLLGNHNIFKKYYIHCCREAK